MYDSSTKQASHQPTNALFNFQLLLQQQLSVNIITAPLFNSPSHSFLVFSHFLPHIFHSVFIYTEQNKWNKKKKKIFIEPE